MIVRLNAQRPTVSIMAHMASFVAIYKTVVLFWLLLQRASAVNSTFCKLFGI